MKFHDFLLKEKGYKPLRSVLHNNKYIYKDVDDPYFFSSLGIGKAYMLLVHPDLYKNILELNSIDGIKVGLYSTTGLFYSGHPPMTLTRPEKAVKIIKTESDGRKWFTGFDCIDVGRIIDKHGCEFYLDLLLSGDSITFDKDSNIVERKKV